MNLHTFYMILQQTLIITTFVIGMMMIIEYINVTTGGLMSKRLQKSPWIQIFFGAVMGIIPGCLGTYTIVSLYIHKVMSFSALIAALIATSGDEAFFMFSLFPSQALKITLILFILAVVVGFIIEIFMKDRFIGGANEHNMPLHNDDDGCHHHHAVKSNLKNISFVRALLIVGCISILILIISGFIDGSHQLNILMGGQSEDSLLHDMTDAGHHVHSHDHEHGGEADWIRYTLTFMFVVILGIVIAAKDHFLEEHLWQHVIKVHLPKIFVWTFLVILALTVINMFVDVRAFVNANLFVVLLSAILIGVIPQSGPHLIFVILFAQGSIPLSILLASSIVQDGHGALPLLAESPKSFFISKGISAVLGLMIGIAGMIIGF